MRVVKWTPEFFLKTAKEKHYDKFDYSKTNFINLHLKITIICPEHGEFQTLPLSHVKGGGGGCFECGKKAIYLSKVMGLEKFIEKSKKMHGEKYDYSKVEYYNSQTKVKIICKIHGEFEQLPATHIQGFGCSKCGFISSNNSKRKDINWFISKAKELHGEKYDYSKVNYTTTSNKVTIICPIHGDFDQRAMVHLIGNGCPKCRYITNSKKRSFTKEIFISKAKEVHGNKYDYSKVEYINSQRKILIICPEHGEFTQIPNSHLNGSGCIKCSASRGEVKIRNYLNKKSIVFEEQKTFPTCKNIQLLRFDFWIPKYNLIIEFDGIQHFPEEVLARPNYRIKFNPKEPTKIRDEIKTKWCEEYQVNLLRIKYDDDIEQVIDDYLEFLNETN